MRRFLALIFCLSFSVSPLVPCDFAQSPAPARSASSVLDTDVAQLHYDDLARDLLQTPPGSVHDLFAGVLADRTSRFDDALRLLTPLLSDTTLSASRRALVLGSLADVSVKLFHYAAASKLYNHLLSTAADGLPPVLLKDDQDDSATLKLLVNAPPQTIRLDGSTPAAPAVDLRTHSDPLRDITVHLTVHGVKAPWILDTGANFSTVSASFAHRLGLAPSQEAAQTEGVTGAENPLHTAILDTLTIGHATLHNVVVLILPDANLTIRIRSGGKRPYVIPAILGYPVFQSLGTIRFRHRRFQAGNLLPVSGDAASADGSSPIYMEKLNVLFSCRSYGLARSFLFDSGANSSNFYLPYYHDFPAAFLHPKRATRSSSGVGGSASDQVYLLDNVDLELAGRTVELQHIPVSISPQHTLSDEFEGSLGRDLISNTGSLTLDLAHDSVYAGSVRN